MWPAPGYGSHGDHQGYGRHGILGACQPSPTPRPPQAHVAMPYQPPVPYSGFHMLAPYGGFQPQALYGGHNAHATSILGHCHPCQPAQHDDDATSSVGVLHGHGGLCAHVLPPWYFTLSPPIPPTGELSYEMVLYFLLLPPDTHLFLPPELIAIYICIMFWSLLASLRT